jgi:parallel beta-helix repeat protein
LLLEVLEDRSVPAVTVTDLNTHATFTSIQAAINAANPGDVLQVSAGTDNENVTVNKSVALIGAQFGVDARTRSGPETVMDAAGNAGKTPFYITANNVVIDGFTIQGETSANQFGFGILIGAGTSGARIVNNIVQNNVAGISLANAPGGNPAVIQHNLFQNNNQPGPVSGTAIYTDQFNAGGPLANVLIDANTFTNNQNAGVIIGPTTAAGAASNITISNNTFTSNGNGVLLFNALTSTITRNTISGGSATQVVIGGGVNGLTVTQNFIQSGSTRGIRIGDFGGGGTNQNVSVNQNFISGNATSGLEIDSAANAYTGTLDATNNYWGSPSGPNTRNNSSGSGDKIIDANNQVSFRPYLTIGTDTDPNTPGFQPVQEFVYDASTRTLSVRATSFVFTQATSSDASGNLSSIYNLGVDGTTPESFTSAMVAQILVTGASANNTATLYTGDTYIGNDGRVHETVEFISLGRGIGGVTKYNSAGQPSSFMQLANFGTSYAYAGPADGGAIQGSPSSRNTFVSAGVYSYMTSAGEFHLISGAGYVYGYSGGRTDDVAYHYDGSGASTLVLVGTDYSYMVGTDQGRSFTNFGVGFTHTTGIAQHSGQTAYFYDNSPRNDVFLGTTGYSYMYSANPDGTFSEFDYATGFAQVFANASVGGTDYAYNNDPDHIHVSGNFIVNK